MGGDVGVVAENFYYLLTFEPLQNFQLGVSRLLKLRLVHYLSSDELQSHPESPARRRKRFSSVRLPLLRACSTILAHTEEDYPVHGLHVYFPKEE